MRNSPRTFIAAVVFAVMTFVGLAMAQPYGQGMMGGYGPGWMMGGGCGPGWMMGPGYGPGMMGGGYGPGMMGGGYGPGMMGGGYGPGMMGGGYGPGYYGRQGNINLSLDDVETYLERMLVIRGNPRLKLGEVKEKDADTITADIVTKDKEGLVQRFAVDRHTGFFRPVEE